MKKNQKSKFLKATTAVAVAASVVAVAAPIAPEASTFKDVPSSHQFSDAIKSLSDRGIINGYQDGTFKPGQNLTRGQAAKIIAGVLGLETTNVINPNFKDIPTNHQYYGAIAALKQAGIIDGYEDGTFRQGANIQRNHVAKIIANALNLKSTNADALPFTDVRADYKEAIAALYENNVTTGKTATKFDGASNVTRGQMAAFITRAEAVAKTTPETSRSVTFKVTDYTTAGIIVDGTTYSYSDSVKSIFTKENIEALNGASIVASVTNGVITNVNSLTLNNAGTAEKEVVFKSNATIDALTINADYVSVSGLIVTGNATVTTNVGNSVELDGSTVNGDLIIDDAIVGKVASLDNKFANDEKNGPKVKLKNSKAGKIHVKRNDTAIESDTVITEITVAASVSLINVDGTVTKVTVESTAKLELTGNANIAQLLLTTAVELALQIKGTVEALAVSNPATQITVGTNLKINELSVPAGSTAAGIVSNFSAIASQIVNVIVGTTPNAGTPSTGGGGAGGGTGGNIQTPNPTPGADALAAAKIAASKLIATDYTPASYRAVTNAVAAAVSAKTDIEKLAAAKAITDAIAALVAPTEATIVQSATVSTNDATEDNKGKWTFVITPTTALVEGDQLIISSKDFNLSQLANSDISVNTTDTESIKSRIEIHNSNIPGHHDLVIYLNTAIDAGESITVTIVDEKITNPKAGLYDKAFVIATSKDVKAKYVPVTISESQLLATYPVTFTSADGATIVVRDSAGNEVTDLRKVANGTYSYLVTKEGYKTVEGTFNVEGAAKEVVITLEADANGQIASIPTLVGDSTITSGDTIKLSVTTGDTVYYTLDGSTPTKTSDSVTVTNGEAIIPVTGDGLVILKVYAVINGGIDSSVAVFQLKVELITPTAPVVIADDEANTIIGLADGMEYSTDGETWIAFNPENVPTFTGTQTVQVRVAAVEGVSNPSNSVTLEFTNGQSVVTTADVKDLDELKLALSNEDITTINITEDISGIEEALHVDRKVTINGEGNTLAFTTALNKLANGERQGILVTADGVVMNGLTVQMAGELATDSFHGWQGVYGIQVYDATDVTLNDVTTLGADGGILVNGSAVELTGTTTVSGNEFGGIEVSKGTATGLSNSILTVTGAVTNGTESYGQPTIWVITGQGTVTGIDAWSTNTTIKSDQIQYYQVAKNAVDPVATTADVKDLDELKLALSNEDITTINITEDISGIEEALHVDRKVTINGEGNTLAFTTALNKLANGERQGILVTADGVVMNGLTVQMAGELATDSFHGWQGVYGIQVYDATDVTLNDVTTLGADGGILVNGSAVELTGTTTVSGNEFGGIEVSKGTATGLSNSILTVTGAVTNGTESYGQPTIWVITGQGTVTGIDAWSTNTTIKSDQIQYYQVAKNAVDPVATTADVKDLDELKLALSNEDITTINITEDISGIEEALHVDRKVTINGEGNTLAFTTALNKLANGERQGILVTADGVVMNGLTVQMAGELATDSFHGWQGVYGIQVYDATDVTLNDVTTLGADGGILVNGSAVELTGTTTVSGNEFGGIEVSKGTATGLSNSILTVTGAVTNGTESYGQPTIWVITGQGTVTGIDAWSTNTTIKSDQIQYYQVAKNAVDPVATTADVKDLDELKLALSNEDITTINITEDISGIEEALHVDRKVTINGEGNTLAFTTALNKLANGERQGILVTADGVVMNGLTIQMAGELATDSFHGWQGVYGIQVYDATDVTLNDVTTLGADGGILVNGSAVELTGTTTVSGNEFGGIEVSKGTVTGLSNSILTVTGAVTNGTESYGQPTIWVITGQGTVTGIDAWSTNTTIKSDQTQYYQVAKNAVDPVVTKLVDEESEVPVATTLIMGVNFVILNGLVKFI